MTVELQTQRASFPALSGGPQSMNLSFTFASNVRVAGAAINGFEIGFDNDDHPILRTQIDAEVISINGATVVVRVTFSLRDNSGHFDDPFSGFVDVLVIVDRF
jgi:hypothetical protein